MRPFRRHPRLAWVALFALAAQLALAFGHIHDAQTRRHEAQRAALGRCPAAASNPCAPSNQSEHDDLCAICWTLGIAGSLILPTSFALAAPTETCDASVIQCPVAQPFGDTPSPFQARAPPTRQAI
jgi:hypothetical protein